MGCDFCGIVVALPVADGGKMEHEHGLNARVCGAVYGYNAEDPCNGAFSEYLVADGRMLLRVPPTWTNLQGAALGGIGWGTVGLALWDPKALALTGRPSKPEQNKNAVLVYGGGTATGTMACQILQLSGYDPISTTSVASAALALEYGASHTIPYTSLDCVTQIKTLTAPMGGIKCVLDCITDPESAAICFGAIYRAGGRYACLEAFDPAWITRRRIVVENVLGYEMWGNSVCFGPDEKIYSRSASPGKHQATIAWTEEMQSLLDAGLIMHHPLKEISGKWEGVIRGLGMLQRGEVRGHKLVVRLAEAKN